MTHIAAPADRRFRRAHVKPGRRRRDWRRLLGPLARRGIVATVLVVGGYRASIAAAHAPALQIDRIVVHGTERLSKTAVLETLNGLRGESIIFTDLSAWRRRLLASAWVRDAALRRSLPSTVEIAISERRPLALARIAGDMYLVDDRGVIIDRYGPQYADLDLPIVDGLAEGATAGVMTDPARGELAARLMSSIGGNAQLARRLSQIDVSDLHNAAVILTGEPATIRLGEEQFRQRLESYLGLAEALRARVADIDSVDLRFEGRIYVQPHGRLGKRRQ